MLDRGGQHHADSIRQRITKSPVIGIADRETETRIGIEFPPARVIFRPSRNRGLDSEADAHRDHRKQETRPGHRGRHANLTTFCYRIDFAQRNPIVAARCLGEAPLLVAVRSNTGALFQEPPRTTL